MMARKIILMNLRRELSVSGNMLACSVKESFPEQGSVAVILTVHCRISFIALERISGCVIIPCRNLQQPSVIAILYPVRTGGYRSVRLVIFVQE